LQNYYLIGLKNKNKGNDKGVENRNETMQNNSLEKNSLEQAAVLMVFLDSKSPGAPTKIISELGEKNSKRILKAITELGKLSPSQIQKSIENFHLLAIDSQIIFGGKEISQKLIQETFGITEQEEFFSEKMPMFTFLNNISDKKLLEFISNCNLQFTAIILNYLDENRMFSILDSLPMEDTNILMDLLLNLNIPNKKLLLKLQLEMEEKLLGPKKLDTLESDKLLKLARVLESMTDENQKRVFTYLTKKKDPSVEKLKSLIFNFINFKDLPNKDIQTIIFEIDPLKTLAIALKESEKIIEEKFLNNSSDRIRIRFTQEVELLEKKISIKEIQSKQKEIIRIARTLEKDKKISKLQVSHE